MNKKFTFFLFICVICCSFKQPNYCKISDIIYFDYNKELCKDKHLFLVGKGGDMMHDVEKVHATYYSFEKMAVEDARRLYVEIAEGYISRYNENEQIRPYLHNYPFTINNFHIMIGFQDLDHRNTRFRGEGFVAMVANSKEDRIFYCTYDHEKEKFINLHDEPYATARAIVLSEKSRSQFHE
jgi:hypothetical protein